MIMRVPDVIVAFCALALVTGVAACAKGDTDSGVATSGSPGGTQPSVNPASTGDRQKWLRCLEEQGVKILDGKPDYLQTDKEKMALALKACEQYDTPQELVRPLTAAEIEMYRKWAQCMRDQGIDTSDPDPNVAGGRPVPGSTLAPRAEVERAEKACENLAAPTAGLGR